MKRSLASIFLIGIFFSLDAVGQHREGYVVALNGDTLRGTILNHKKGDQQAVEIRYSGSDHSYTPGDIRGYGIAEGFQFISYEDTFIEALVLGSIDLFKNENKFYLRKDGVFTVIEKKMVIQTVKGKTFKRQDTGWTGLVTLLFKDCGNGPIQPRTLNLNEKAITDLVVDYNKCSGQKFVEVKRNIPWIGVSAGLAAGVGRSSLRFNSSESEYLPKKYTTDFLTGGVSCIITFPRSQRGIAVQPEFHISKATYSHHATIDNMPADIRYHDSRATIYTLSTPLTLRFDLIKGRISPFANVGMNMDWNLKSDSQLLSEVVANNVVNVQPEQEFLRVPAFQFGALGGLGVRADFASLKVSASIRYAVNSTPVKTENNNGNISKMSFLIIISRK